MTAYTAAVLDGIADNDGFGVAVAYLRRRWAETLEEDGMDQVSARRAADCDPYEAALVAAVEEE